jgi:sterol desaturase/sphingolipid hydroxylase (fatty acid hydroxylase superfamily)
VAGVVRVLLLGPRGRQRALNTVQHHDMHHRFPRNHFSLYFTHWDRWCGTLHPKYDEKLFSYFE